jgi:hypothetical protein
MDWFAPVDLYCERTAPGLFNEPFNALSNVAFLAAAALALAQRHGRRDLFLAILIALVCLIGLGSTAFHMFANRWSLVADTTSIAAFIYAFFLYAMLRFVALSWAWSLTLTALFFVASYLFGRVIPPDILNGSLGYLPALLGLVALGAYLFAQRFPAAPLLLAAAAVLLVSLTFRTIDLAVCSCIPTGTHFLWHALNGLVLYLALLSAIRFGGLASSERPT